jgi:hypothetical protein
MSFDIFIMCFRNGEPSTIKRETFEEIFLPFCNRPDLVESDPEYMLVRFPDGSGSAIYSDKEPLMESLMFNHCGGEAVFEAMYQLAARTASVIYWPSEGPGTVITDEVTRKELPENFPDRETARIVHSGADIRKAIAES